MTGWLEPGKAGLEVRSLAAIPASTDGELDTRVAERETAAFRSGLELTDAVFDALVESATRYLVAEGRLDAAERSDGAASS